MAQLHRRYLPCSSCDSITGVTAAPDNPLDDIAALRAALAAEQLARREAEARASGAETMVAHLKLLIARLKRDKYGASSERGRKLIDQLELELGELVAAASEDAAKAEKAADKQGRPRRPDRLPLLRRQAVQAGRGHHGDARGRSDQVEGHPDRARAVLVPCLRNRHPAA